MIAPEMVAPGAIQMLVEYLVDEIRRSLGERAPLESKWKAWHKLYRATPDHEIKTFPFHGAANLVIPVAATDIDVTIARLVGILFAPDNLFSTRARRPEMIEFARALQEFLQAVQFAELDAFNATVEFVAETCKLGTGILKTRYRRETKTVYEFRETADGIVERHQQLRTKDHPEFKHVSLFDFLVPATAIDIKSAPWCGERVLLTRQQYLNRVREGIYLPVERVLAHASGVGTSHILENLMQLDKFKAGRPDQLDFWECWLEFDIGQVGEPRPLVATIHLPTFSLVRLDWNPYISQVPPYDFARFMRQEKRFYGIGMCEMLAPFQYEITAMHNQRIDSGTLANSTMFKGRTGAVREDEPIVPGRWFILDNLDDVQVMNLNSGKLDSSVQYEPITLEYAKRRSGVNEYIAGHFAPSVGYATAHTNLQQLQQATQRFDQTLRELRNALGGAVGKAVELYQQFDRPGKVYEILGDKDGALMEAFIMFPTAAVRDAVAIEVTATSAALNKEIEIRTNTILMQMLSQFYSEVINGLMLAFNPQLPPQLQAIILQMVQGGTILMRRILEAHGVQDTDDLVPHIRGILSGQLPIGQLVGEGAGLGVGGLAGADALGGGSQLGAIAPQPQGVGIAGNGNGQFMGAGLPFAR